jgi:glycosyltransferase involved in cell wall biosynthesis
MSPQEIARSMRICRIVTVPITFETLYREQLEYLAREGIDVTIVSSPGVRVEAIAKSLKMNYIPITMNRKVQPLHDLKTLVVLTKLFRNGQFDIVHSSTPKAGLLAALAGIIARVPIRIHTFTGQVWVEMGGMRRKILRLCDWIIGHLNTRCYADSASQRDFLIGEHLVNASRISVLGPGSVGGVDLERFDPNKFGNEHAQAVRHELGISEKARVILFVGRLTKDKGIRELVSAFLELQKEFEEVALVLVGPFEPERDPLPKDILEELSYNPHIHVVGFSEEPEKYMAAADLFCLPSYREGFGSVIVEAAAMGLPSIASGVVGLVDAVMDGETGLLVPPKDVDALKNALMKMIPSPKIRKQMGRTAHERALRDFDSRIINRLLVKEYQKLAARLADSK